MKGVSTEGGKVVKYSEHGVGECQGKQWRAT
jgi:hypothetical protein